MSEQTESIQAHVETETKLQSELESQVQKTSNEAAIATELKSVVEGLESRVSEQEALLSQHRAANLTLKGEIGDLSLESNGRVQAAVELQGELSECEAKFVVTEAERSEFEHRLIETSVKVEQLTEELERASALSEEVTNLTAMIATLQEASKFAADGATKALDATKKVSKDTVASLTRERDELRHAIEAHVAHSAFLTIELNTLRRSHSVAELTLERKLQNMKSLFRETKSECQQLEKERRALTTKALLNQMGGEALAPLLAEQERNLIEIERLKNETDSIAKSYFLSFAISVKMNLSVRGNFVNVNVHDLWEESQANDIHWDEYPGFITQKLEAEAAAKKDRQ